MQLPRVARRDRTLPDPKTRNLENRIVDALRAHSAGDLEEAIQLYHDVLRLKLPNRAIRSMIYNHRGIAHLALSRPARALEDFASAVRWNEENARAHFNLGLAHRALGKPTLALRALRRAAKAQTGLLSAPVQSECCERADDGRKRRNRERNTQAVEKCVHVFRSLEQLMVPPNRPAGRREVQVRTVAK